MAMTITAYGSDTRDITTYPQWFVWDAAGVVTEGSGGVDEEGDLITIPIGTVIIDASICCIVAGAGTGDDVLSVEIDDGTTERTVFTGTADNGGAVDVIDRSVTVDGSAFPTTAEQTLRVVRTISDDVTTPAEYRVAILMYRDSRP